MKNYALRYIFILCLCFSYFSCGDRSLPDLVDVKEVIPGVVIDARYAGENNFVGVPIDGYSVPRVLLTADAANALRIVQLEIKKFGFGLKIFDGYRPQRAVDHFMRWIADGQNTLMKEKFFPRVAKGDLVSDGYIAQKSGHSRGSSVDLTLVDLASKTEVPMGTQWDFFDPLSFSLSYGVTPMERSNRLFLRRQMRAAGFLPLAEEWWHFTLRNEPYPNSYFNLPID